MRKKSVGDHGDERMTMRAMPVSTGDGIATEFLFQLPVRLLADPARLDGGRMRAQERTAAAMARSISARARCGFARGGR